MRIPRKDERRTSQFSIAADDAARFAREASVYLERALGVQWYERPGNAADLAALSLCRLRRAGAALGGAGEHGDQAVRAALAKASPETIVWIASRAISYMDESGFPEAVEPYAPREEGQPGG
ncbi:MAG TPA: hypothetical protein VNJ46_08965 [Gaiellaceae bacterium]|nr:hypothetical protein [Gaiellaceae bacterium]